MNSPRAGPGMAPPRPMSPAGAQRSMSPAGAQRAMSPAPFNQAPRPLSPGPRPQPKRSMSPGPYGGRGGPPPMAGVVNKRRSNSASNVRDKRNSPIGPSKLGVALTAPGTAL
jgi:hypothetical protein